jgi:hypothetical protein
MELNTGSDHASTIPERGSTLERAAAHHDLMAREGLDRMDDAQLLKEYREMLRAGFGQMFGMNARRRCNACVDVLAARGITEAPSIFGPSKISKWTY